MARTSRPGIPYVEAIYRRFHMPAMFRVTPLMPPALDAALTERGYSNEDERVLLRAELTPAAARRRRTRSPKRQPTAGSRCWAPA